MAENLDAIKVQRKTGQENFTVGGSPVNLKLVHFWQWSQADLLSNATRGVLAEFIVASALELDMDVRTEWDAYDFKTKKGLKIEIKSAAYLQSWKQEKLSAIQFRIAPTKGWYADTNKFSEEIKRQSDIYIFCILDHKDKRTVDPLNLDQWKFYLLETSKLDEKLKNQKTLTLSGLLKLNPLVCTFLEIKPAVEKFEMKYCYSS
jgi:hypothetical protein